MLKGKFEIYENQESGLIKIGESYNRMTYDGMEMMMDFMFGIESWFSGAAGYDGTLPASGAWHPYRYIALGYSADDNDDWLLNVSKALTGAAGGGDNITGGTGISGDCVAVSDIGHFPSLSDSYMSSIDISETNKNVGTGLFYKIADRTIRTARTVTIEATFSTDATLANGNATTIPEGTKIRELGIFLDEPISSIEPSNNRDHRTGAMICRSVRYEVSGGYVQDNPITVGANDLTVRYTFGENV